MEALAIAAVVLLALLVGLVIPVLFQLRSTLKRAEQFIDSTSIRTDGALTELAQLTARVNRVVGEVEANLPRMQRALQATDGIVATLESVRGPLQVVAAIGPAAFAAMKSLVASFVASRAQAADASAAEENMNTPEHQRPHVGNEAN